MLASILACSGAMADTPAAHEVVLPVDSCLEAWCTADKPVAYERLSPGDLHNLGRVMAYMKVAPKKHKQWAESGYQHAQRATQRLHLGSSWGGVAKGSMESLMSYPTAKAYLLLVEAKLKASAEYRIRDSWEKNHPEWTRENLQRAADWLDVAMLVNAFEPTLSDAQHKDLIAYRACLRRYLETDRREADCVPLQWAGEIPAQKTENPQRN
ncbi:MAG: hypothetical protein LBQ75_00890 [Zoogloeaceae bacterium]|nr:hypothetical protein [Zoogloeaceae bacterium]